jgi:hypothetical protein
MRKGRNTAPLSASPMHRSHSVSVRPIANGFVKSVSRDTADGYEHRETFHRKMPSLGVGRDSACGDATGSCGLRGAKDELC